MFTCFHIEGCDNLFRLLDTVSLSLLCHLQGVLPSVNPLVTEFEMN